MSVFKLLTELYLGVAPLYSYFCLTLIGDVWLLFACWIASIIFCCIACFILDFGLRVLAGLSLTKITSSALQVGKGFIWLGAVDRPSLRSINLRFLLETLREISELYSCESLFWIQLGRVAICQFGVDVTGVFNWFRSEWLKTLSIGESKISVNDKGLRWFWTNYSWIGESIG